MNSSSHIRRIGVPLQFACFRIILPMSAVGLIFGWKFHTGPPDVLPLYPESYGNILEHFVRIDVINTPVIAVISTLPVLLHIFIAAASLGEAGNGMPLIINGDELTELVAFATLMTISWLIREGGRLARQNAEFI